MTTIRATIDTSTPAKRLAYLNDTFGGNHVELQDLLLDFGGDGCIMNFEEDEDKLFSRGKRFDAQRITLRKGREGQCHRNAGYLWDKYKSYKICTGYALSTDNDGLQLWRQHSWCLDTRDRIVETISNRDIYFGFILNKDESEQFWQDNTL